MTDQGEAGRLSQEFEAFVTERGNVSISIGLWAIENRSAIIAALRAKPASPGEGGAVAWMIEQTAATVPQWFAGEYTPWEDNPRRRMAAFTSDPNAAVRYPTKGSAQNALDVLLAERPRVVFQADCYAITEHQWFAAPPQAEQDMVSVPRYLINRVETFCATLAEFGMQAKLADGSYTPNGELADGIARDFRTLQSKQPAEARTERSIAYDVWQRCNGQEQPLEMCRISVREGHAAGFAEAAATVQKMLDDLAGVDDYAAPHYRFILRIAVKKLQPKEGGR